MLLVYSCKICYFRSSRTTTIIRNPYSYNCFIANSISLKCRRPFQVTTFHPFGVMQRSLVFYCAQTSPALDYWIADMSWIKKNCHLKKKLVTDDENEEWALKRMRTTIGQSISNINDGTQTRFWNDGTCKALNQIRHISTMLAKTLPP